MSKYLFVVRPCEAKLGSLHKIMLQKDNIFKVGCTVENNLNKDYGINSGGQIYLITSNKTSNHNELITSIKKRLRESEFNQISIKTGATDLKSGFFIGNASNAVNVIKKFLSEKEPALTFDARYELQVEGKIDVESKIDNKNTMTDVKSGVNSDLLNRIIAVENENKALKENAQKIKGVFATILSRLAEAEIKLKVMNEVIAEIKEGQTVASDEETEETEENDEETED
jgi:hypothetical protein